MQKINGLKIAGLYILGLTTLMLFVSAKLVSSSITVETETLINLTNQAAQADALANPSRSIKITQDDPTGIAYVVTKKRERRERRAQRRTRTTYASSRKVVSMPVEYTAILDSIGRTSVRGKILAEAKKHLGAKYVWASARPGAFDCSGFTSYVMGKNGIKITRSSRYQARQGKAVDLKQVKTGDLVFFSKYGKGGRVTHVAMVVDNGKEGIHVIHATRRGVVVDNLLESSYWKPKILYAKDVIGS